VCPSYKNEILLAICLRSARRRNEKEYIKKTSLTHSAALKQVVHDAWNAYSRRDAFLANELRS